MAAAARAVPARSLTSVDPARTCPSCGTEVTSTDGFCDSCGQRRPTGKNHTELDLGAVAGVTDIGHRHHVNEDAIAIGVRDGAVIGIVCDGVSSSSRADTASHAAVDAAMTTMLDALGDGDDPSAAIAAGAGQPRRAAPPPAAAAAGKLLGQPLTEREVRFGLERAYRVLAAQETDPLARYALVDEANAVRPRTVV